jgi:hypothetical protein
MDRATYDDYIERFNAEDRSAFDQYIAPTMHMQNGTLHFDGAQGMKDHYAKIWGSFKETVYIENFVSDEHALAVKMWTHFDALVDLPDSLFGPVKKGETFDFRGVVMYKIEDGKFIEIVVAYNSFVFTDASGQAVDRGIPH